MRRMLIFRAAAAALMMAGVTSQATAQISAFWQRVPITPQAIASDPVLANIQCWDLMATITGFWRTGGLRAELSSGQFYNHPFGGNARPPRGFIEAFPALEFDTYITAPGDTGPPGNAPAIFGGFPEGEPFSMAGSLFSVGWGQLFTHPRGTYEIARLTFPLGVFPEVLNNDPSPVPTFSRTTQTMPDAIAEIPEVPEPGTLGGCGAVAALFALRRRSR